MPAGLPQSPDILRLASQDVVFNSLYLQQGIYPVAGNAPSAIWAQGGTTVLATSGTDVACTNGTVYYVEVVPLVNKVVTGIAYLIGSVGGTDKVIATLHDASGNVLANSALAGATVGTAANIQSVAFTATYQVFAFTRYYIGLTFNGTTAKFRAYPIPGSPFYAGSATQTFGTAAAFTPAGTFTADKGPISLLY